MYRVIVEHTVEERMLALQDRKAALADSALSTEGGTVSVDQRLTVDDLKYFFTR